jgi:hypothetical protein
MVLLFYLMACLIGTVKLSASTTHISDYSVLGAKHNQLVHVLGLVKPGNALPSSLYVLPIRKYTRIWRWDEIIIACVDYLFVRMDHLPPRISLIQTQS